MQALPNDESCDGEHSKHRRYTATLIWDTDIKHTCEFAMAMPNLYAIKPQVPLSCPVQLHFHRGSLWHDSDALIPCGASWHGLTDWAPASALHLLPASRSPLQVRTRSSSSAPSAAMKVQSRYSWMVEARGASAALVPALGGRIWPVSKALEEEWDIVAGYSCPSLDPAMHTSHQGLTREMLDATGVEDAQA